MGEPAKICALAEGAENWIYPRGPAGLHTFNVRVDREGRLRGIENVLEDSGFARVRAGVTTREDVLCLFGPPIETIRYPARRETVWDYRFRDAWGYVARFHVLFDDAGVVTGTLRIREERPGPDR